MSICRNVNLPKCQLAETSICRNVNLPYCQCAELRICRNVIYLVEISFRLRAFLPKCAFALKKISLPRLCNRWCFLRSNNFTYTLGEGKGILNLARPIGFLHTRWPRGEGWVRPPPHRFAPPLPAPPRSQRTQLPAPLSLPPRLPVPRAPPRSPARAPIQRSPARPPVPQSCGARCLR